MLVLLPLLPPPMMVRGVRCEAEQVEVLPRSVLLRVRRLARLLLLLVCCERKKLTLMRSLVLNSCCLAESWEMMVARRQVSKLGSKALRANTKPRSTLARHATRRPYNASRLETHHTMRFAGR